MRYFGSHSLSFNLIIILSVIVTSGPSSTYPQRAYRNPTDALVKFLDYKHKAHWAIWEFRAEGTGYPDSEVHGRIRHYPWPDHHPPPFALIPNIMASMRNWLKDPDALKDGRVVVVHCKAGKGRSGTVACSYLISEEGWDVEEALSRFTQRRMRVGFGAGVSIPSQLRWVGYVDRWTKNGKIYVERQVEIMEVHVWGLRDGVKVAIEGFIDEGRTIKTFHVFHKKERLVVDKTVHSTGHLIDSTDSDNDRETSTPETTNHTNTSTSDSSPPIHTGTEPGGPAVIFRPSTRIVLPTNDINIDFERRNRATYGWTMVTSVAHVWFNAYFEGSGPENNNTPSSSGVFEIEWDAMDGIKGSSRKGTRALERLAVVWRALDDSEGIRKIVTEPAIGEPVPESGAADWQKANEGINPGGGGGKDLGLRVQSPVAGTSPASSIHNVHLERRAENEDQSDDDDDDMAGVQSHALPSEPGADRHGKVGFGGVVAGIVKGMKHVSTSDLPDGKPEGEMETAKQEMLGKISREKSNVV